MQGARTSPVVGIEKFNQLFWFASIRLWPILKKVAKVAIVSHGSPLRTGRRKLGQSRLQLLSHTKLQKGRYYDGEARRYSINTNQKPETYVSESSLLQKKETITAIFA